MKNRKSTTSRKQLNVTPSTFDAAAMKGEEVVANIKAAANAKLATFGAWLVRKCGNDA